MPKPDIKTALSFLEAMRPGGPWTLGAIHPDGGVPITETFDDIEAAKLWIEHYADTHGLYFNDARLRRGANRRHKMGKNAVGSQEYVKADLDEVDGKRLSGKSTKEKKALVAKLLGEVEGIPGPPTFIIDSGNGIQALWKLEDPIDLELEDEVERNKRLANGEGLSRTLCNILGADSCWSINHLFRLPGTINFPNERKREMGLTVVPTKLLHAEPERAYETWLFELDEHLVAASQHLASTDIGPPEEIANLAEFAAEHMLPQWLVNLILAGKEEDEEEAVDRSAHEWKVCNELFDFGVTPEEVLGVLTNLDFGISARSWDKGGKTYEGMVAYAIKTVKRAYHHNKHKRLEEFEPLDGPITDEGDSAVVQEAPKVKWKRWSVVELLNLPAPRWLIDRMMIENGFIMLYGAPKTGKTFNGLDIALHVAMGMDYYGRKVMQGRVCYVAAEGSVPMIRDRILAWCILNKVDPKDLTGRFELVTDSVFLDNDKVRKAFIKVDRGPYVLTVFDTLKQNSEGDENDGKAMQAVVNGAHEVRRETGCVSLVIHHTGHGNTARERGSSVFRGAADAIYRLSWAEEKKVSKLETDVARDCGDIEPLFFELAEVPVNPQDVEAELRMGHAVKRLPDYVPKDTEEEKSPKKPKRVKRSDKGSFIRTATQDSILIEVLVDMPPTAKDLVNEEEEGRSRPTVYRILRELRDAGLITKSGLALTDEGRARAEEAYANTKEPDDD